ncbi:hypothetical protein [Pseudalkalibacillus hwajinpoensis]|uniref:Uncharacterized protein n=1 Tax=Guptibacillus hwajinpoensis TaxID=208199 RepID=A0A4U1MFX8_9BACL|nr:hypothetical protein [Pseudalkalibacillus hwajinpoensis]TKD69180.1 hypothetical protein FBF83_14335 [Pseudalkalibacillus hwajinpoensis]
MKKFGIPILTAFVILLLVFLHQLSILQEKPDESWSRTVDLNVAARDNQMFTQKEDDQTTLYFSGDPVRKVTVNEQLEVETEDLSYAVPEGYSFYVDDQQAIYKNKDALVYSNNDKEETIVENIEGLNASDNGIVAWSRHQLYFITPEGTIESATKISPYIKSAVLTEDGKALLYVQTDAMNQFFTLEQSADPELVYETALSSGELFSNLQAIYTDKGLVFTYTAFATRQGTRIVNTYYGESVEGKMADVNLLKISNTETGDDFTKPNYFSLNEINGEPHLLFSANGEISPKREVISIYEATQQNDEWVAFRRSTSEELSIRPVSVSESSVIWIDKEKSGYVLHGSTTSPDVVKSSNATTGQDLKTALFYTFTAIVGMFAMLAFSFGFLILPAVGLMYLYFANTTAIEQDKKWVEWAIVLLCVGSQMIFLPSILDGPFQYLAPSYLTFQGAAYVWPIIIFLASFIISRLGQDQEWTILQRTSYQLGLNLGILIFLLGPYIL